MGVQVRLETSVPLELEIQATVNRLVCVLGTEPSPLENSGCWAAEPSLQLQDALVWEVPAVCHPGI